VTGAKSSSPDAEGSQTVSGRGPSDAALVVAARAGERWAQEAIFRRHAPMINRLAYRLMAGDADVDDVVQDVFVAALRRLDRLQDPQALAGWLRAIVVGTVHKRVRKARLLRRLGLLRREEIDFDEFVSQAASPEIRAELAAIYRLAEELSVDERSALILHRVEGRSLAQVAEEMGLSLATVKRRLAKADERLARMSGGEKSSR
jgi:RNA polymerase sigma-70 factor, ECF subfamily